MANVWEIVTATCQLTLRLVMGLAFVGAVCRKSESRAWWLGFAVLGWIYLEAALTPSEFAVPLPTEMLLMAVGPSIIPLATRMTPRWAGLLDAMFSLWHCLWALLAAFFGGFLARQIFGTITRREEQSPSSPGSAEPSARRGIGSVLLYLTGLELAILIIAGGALLPSQLWAGLTFVLTWWVLGLLALRASRGERNRRVRSLFASVLGISLLILFFGRSDLDPWPISPTVELLDDIRPWVPAFMNAYPAGCEVRSAANARVHQALEQKVRMHFVEETPLEDVLDYVQKQTADSGGKPIRIEVGPLYEGGGEVNLTMSPSLRMTDLDGVPLRTSLKLGLEQLDLTYQVRNGVLVIHSTESGDQVLFSIGRNAYQSVGHCLLALIAAGLGGALAPFVCNVARRREPADSHGME